MTQATFSNGFTDTYKGHRAVKAAWMITNKATGEVVASGHSLDRAKAAKTAQGAMSAKAYGFGPIMPTRAYPGMETFLRRCGYNGNKSTASMVRWSREKNADRLARIGGAHDIEIIDL